MQKRLADRLAEEFTENIEETRLVKITLAKNENKHKCSSCTMYIVLFSIFLPLMLELVAIFFIFIGTQKKVLLVLSLVPTLKQRFNELFKMEAN